ncbi:MAG: HAD family hydrolase [Planctomycetota bacterium]
MNLLVFDLDGTLTRTNDVDARCFAESMIDLLPPGVMDTDRNIDWASYEHTTDPGIVEELWDRVRGRSPHDEEIRRHQSRFLELLRAAAEQTPEQFGLIEGAQAVLDHLADPAAESGRHGWRACIATGSWGVSAPMKIEAAGLQTHDLPIATGDDGMSREEIVRAAVAAARNRYGVAKFDRVVSVGDAIWDVRNAANLELPFLGVGDGERAKRLIAAGADHVMKHYPPPAAFLDLAASVGVPRSA